MAQKQEVQQEVKPIVIVDSDTDTHSEPESKLIFEADPKPEIVHGKQIKCRLRDTVFGKLYESQLWFIVNIQDSFFQFPRPSIRGFYRPVILLAHKSILAAGSPKFHQMFHGHHKNTEVIQIPDHDQYAFQLFLKSF